MHGGFDGIVASFQDVLGWTVTLNRPDTYCKNETFLLFKLSKTKKRQPLNPANSGNVVLVSRYHASKNHGQEKTLLLQISKEHNTRISLHNTLSFLTGRHMNDINYSIVIPCYDSGTWLRELVLRTEKAMVNHEPFEIILVNDKSPDNKTWPVIQELSEQYVFVRGVSLLYNVGQFRATLCGLEQANGQFVITMDDDLQHPPEELPKLISAMKKNPSMDCIMGRYAVKKHNPIRNAGSVIFRKIMDILYNKPTDIRTTSFRIMPESFVNRLILYRIAAPQLGPLIVSTTNKIMNIPVDHHARKQGESGYSLYRCISEGVLSIVNASIAPLRWFSFIGFITAGVAFSLGTYYLIRWSVWGISVEGFTSIILAISFFSGAILAEIGIVGEYIGRIIRELTGMPRYTIEQICD